jgi:hypothetical protein
MMTLLTTVALGGAAGCGSAASPDAGDADNGSSDGGDTATAVDTGTSGAGNFGCDSTSGAMHACIDYTGYPAGTSANFCPASHGTVLAACSHTGSNGGCLLHQPGTTTSQTQWYYGTTAAVVMTMCSAGGGTFVNP